MTTQGFFPARSLAGSQNKMTGQQNYMVTRYLILTKRGHWACEPGASRVFGLVATPV